MLDLLIGYIIILPCKILSMFGFFNNKDMNNPDLFPVSDSACVRGTGFLVSCELKKTHAHTNSCANKRMIRLNIHSS